VRRPFRKWAPMLPSEDGARQGRIVRSAQAAFGTTDKVRSFLNSHHEGLGGRPLDLATASDAGLAAVEAAIAAEAEAEAGAGPAPMRP
jgi:uncharacterized protein (DUF2384 family)